MAKKYGPPPLKLAWPSLDKKKHRQEAIKRVDALIARLLAAQERDRILAGQSKQKFGSTP